jgi:hypothetical protein
MILKIQLNKLIRLIVIIFVILITQNSLGQNPIVVNAPNIGNSNEKINRRIKEREAFIKSYVDSLNTYKNREKCELPYFFISENFDQKYGGKFLLSMHSPISLRKLIIDRIDNYEILWCVNDSSDPRVRLKDTSKTRCLHCKIPFDQFSTQELVCLRLDELMNKKHLNRN